MASDLQRRHVIDEIGQMGKSAQETSVGSEVAPVVKCWYHYVSSVLDGPDGPVSMFPARQTDAPLIMSATSLYHLVHHSY